MTATFNAGDAAELAVVTRGGFIECRHIGSAVVLSPAGETLVSLGNPQATILARSALKPLQSLAMHEAGLQFTDDQARAISLASHTGAKTHTDLVKRMLEMHGLSLSHLQTPPSMPADRATRYEMIRNSEGPISVAHGCSGKHAAMLITCQLNGWDLETYLDPAHPLQQQIIDTVQRFTGEAPSPIVTDGCGAPTVGLSLTGLAQGLRRMATASATSPFPINRNAHALLAAAKMHPHLVEGPGTGDEAAMIHAGVFAKYGAEGISIMAAPDGTVAAVKVLDGSLRAVRVIALGLLAYTGAISKQDYINTVPHLNLDVTGGGQKVGKISVSLPDLRKS